MHGMSFASIEDVLALTASRLIHEVAQRRIDLKTYALGENSWMPSARVLSFVFTPRGMDTRPSNQRRSDPLALDFGLAQATLPDCKLQIGSALHFASTDDKYLMAGGSQKLAFEWGTTEEMDIIKISTRLKTFFAERIRESAGPIILLVHGKELSMTMLKNKGVDTSRWVSGIKDLLGFPQIERSPRRGQQQYPRHEQSNGYRRGSDSRGSYYDDRRGRPRSRSRSPSRASSSYGGPPRRSPPRHPGTSSQDQPRGALAPVYVVDVQQLYETSMQTQSSSKSVSQMAKMIIDLWRSMISGLAIDEQRELVKLRNNPQGQAQATSEANDEEGGSDSDSDFDPNSIIQEAPAPTRKSYIDEGESDDGRSSGSDD
ncbi:hypothetical protein H0H81_008905 [Sphagnurus paluster]|uniref:Uncharacterized protein n=1 Tax=Sphagnurus paluster TaxID=117069 RepID=A0A9P7KGD2_9AGAR|nr:hypothetical protein H0H81_008905 [Sphagnurus paluster]